MNSTERKRARYERRQAARKQQRDRMIGKYDDYDRVISANSLVRAAFQSRRAIRWKASVQKYFMSLMRNIWDTRTKLKLMQSVVQGFISFWLADRGKTRFIRSVHFKERVVQRSLSDNALVPVLSRSLIYDNGASIKGKGIHFHLRRCKAHLQQFYRENGRSNDGWVMLIDFSSYFDNIRHENVKDMLDKAFSDNRIIKLVWDFVKAFGEKSLGIGSQVSQILAVAYVNVVDHYAKERLHLRHYNRYMDDTLAIHREKLYLEWCLEQLIPIYASQGIIVNQKKTQIIPVRHFRFLKVHFTLTDSGKVLMKPKRNGASKERRKLRKFKELVDAGAMTAKQAMQAYHSWRGYRKIMNCHDLLREMDKYFYELFGEWPYTKKERKKHERLRLHRQSESNHGSVPQQPCGHNGVGSE